MKENRILNIITSVTNKEILITEKTNEKYHLSSCMI